jgi:hypothetical protein
MGRPKTRRSPPLPYKLVDCRRGPIGIMERLNGSITASDHENLSRALDKRGEHIFPHIPTPPGFFKLYTGTEKFIDLNPTRMELLVRGMEKLMNKRANSPATDESREPEEDTDHTMSKIPDSLGVGDNSLQKGTRRRADKSISIDRDNSPAKTDTTADTTTTTTISIQRSNKKQKIDCSLITLAVENK